MSDPGSSACLQQWGEAAGMLRWTRPWQALHAPERVPGAWFLGGTLNAASNCLDRHLPDRADGPAVHWEGEPGDRRTITYGELHHEVSAFADALNTLGVGPGDRVALFLGWLPEMVVAMLACARLGAVHAVLPSPLPPEPLADRILDLRPKVLITQDGAWRHGVILPLKARADEALAAVTSVEHTVVVRRTGVDIAWYEGDRWYHEMLTASRARDAGDRRPPRSFPADHPLLVVHLADRGGRPVGIVHGTGGLLAYVAAFHRWGLTAGAEDVLWPALDIAWLAGQTHGVYGPLACGASVVLFEGTLDVPTRSRAWEIIERYGVHTLLTRPSVADNLRQWVDNPPAAEHVATVRRIVTLGEPLRPDSQEWLEKEVGRGQAMLMDGWGQTELGGIVALSPSPSSRLPDPGLDVVDADGASAPSGQTGELVLRNPWAATFVALDSAPTAEKARYWRRYRGLYATGDRARRETGGSITMLGRMDPVVKVSGQLISLTEVRDVLLDHPFVADAEAGARPDNRTGQAIVACVALTPGAERGSSVARDIRRLVRETLGGLAEPRTVVFVDALPEDLTEDQHRRAIRSLTAGTTLERFSVTEEQWRAVAVVGEDAAAGTDSASP